MLNVLKVSKLKKKNKKISEMISTPTDINQMLSQPCDHDVKITYSYQSAVGSLHYVEKEISSGALFVIGVLCQFCSFS